MKPMIPWSLGLLAVLASTSALAQEEEAKTPQVTVLGFQDLADGQNCLPVLARYGRCVEEVQFTDVEDMFRLHTPTERQNNAALRNMGKLYAWMWDDLAYRWASDELIETSLHEAQITRFPELREQWDTTPQGHRSRNYGVPDRSLWIEPSEWVDYRSEASQPLFRLLTSDKPLGTAPIPTVAMLRGRFASRLGYDGRAHQFDIMDGDPESSGPFFEQMYPYDLALTGTETEFGTLDIPLARFVADERLKSWIQEPADRDGDGVLDVSDDQQLAWLAARKDNYATLMFPEERGFDGLRGLAKAEFDSFFESVGVQILRFAREEYTPTHLRVITALMAMRSPPATAGRSGDGDLGAGSEGQTDQDAEALEMMDLGYQGNSSFQLNYNELPDKVVAKYLNQFPEWVDEDPTFLAEFRDQVNHDMGDLLRQPTRPIEHLDPVFLKSWCESNAMPGKGLFVNQFMERIALAKLVQPLDESARDQLETRMLLEHVNVELSSQFPKDVWSTPLEMEDMASSAWVSVLTRHGFFSEAIGDGRGKVDPLAVCTTRDRLDALDEPVFGTITVDELVVAPAELEDTDDVLWQARDQVPFLLLDDPVLNPAEVRRLVQLPGGRAVYRVRWEVWTGWHLLWAPEVISPEEGTYRLAMRTAAFCDDTVLAPPDLVPTLVRAGMLDREFAPTVPVRGRGRNEVREFQESSNDELVGGFSQSLYNADAASDTVSLEQSTLGTDGLAVLNSDALTGLAKLFDKISGSPSAEVPPIQNEAVEYVQDLVREPMVAQATDGDALVVVFDQTQPLRHNRTWHWKPKTPYSRTRHHAPGGKVQTAAWAYHIAEFIDDDAPWRTLMVPAYHPTESVNTSSVVQRWRRRSAGEWTLAGGLGMFPLRESHLLCTESSEGFDLGTVGVCGADGDSFDTVRTEGFTLDLSAMRTMWFMDQSRWSIEFGPELHIDYLHPGQSWFYEGNTAFGSTYRYMGGLIVGIRHAPVAGPRVVRGSRTPWGADKPDGSSRLGRHQFGLRVGGLMGPAFNGLEGTLLAEGWMAWSLWRRKAPGATVTPYHPSVLLGPYLRYQHSTVLVEGSTPRYFALDHANSYHAGLRLQLRVGDAVKDSFPESE